MLIFRSGLPFIAAPPKLVLVFGLGLVGKTISVSLENAGYTAQSYPFNWESGTQQDDNASAILGVVERYYQAARAAGNLEPLLDISVVWAAGRAGFGASAEEVRPEQQSFRVVLGIYIKLKSLPFVFRADFHLVSSAGGLFEGADYITADTQPAPCRPYGELKLAIESDLLREVDTADAYIYRPSTVYGLVGGGRTGLIARLIENGMRGTEVPVYGNMDTLRDYVFARDIGNYIAGKIAYPTPLEVVYPLVAGRAFSIYHLKNSVERVLNRKVHVNFEVDRSNARNIVFSSACKPVDWCTTDVELGIRLIRKNYMS